MVTSSLLSPLFLKGPFIKYGRGGPGLFSGGAIQFVASFLGGAIRFVTKKLGGAADFVAKYFRAYIFILGISAIKIDHKLIYEKVLL